MIPLTVLGIGAVRGVVHKEAACSPRPGVGGYVCPPVQTGDGVFQAQATPNWVLHIHFHPRSSLSEY